MWIFVGVPRIRGTKRSGVVDDGSFRLFLGGYTSFETLDIKPELLLTDDVLQSSALRRQIPTSQPCCSREAARTMPV